MRYVLLCFLAVVAFVNPVSAQFVWNNTAGGSWQTGTNWTPNGLPGTADNATINLGGPAYIVTLDVATSVNNLTINSATATLNTSGQGLSIFGAFNLQAGTLTQSGGLTGTFNSSAGTLWNWSNGGLGAGVYTNGGTLNYSGSNGRAISGSIVNIGTWTVTGTGTLFSNSGSGAMTNSGLIDLQVDSTFIAQNQIITTITNTGTLRKSVATGSSTIGAVIDSTGTIDGQAGTLNFINGGTISGTVNAAAGAVVNLASLGLSGPVTGTGGGAVRINGNIVIVAGGATLNYAGSLLEWTAGNIGGPGTLTNAGTLNSTSGNNRSITTTINNTGTIAVTGNGTILSNTGGNAMSNSGLIDLQVDSTWIQANQTTTTITNTGTLRKSAGAGTSTIGAVFNSTNTIEALSGTLNFINGGTISGTVNASIGATVNLGSLTLSGTVTGTGGGLVRIDNGSINIAAGGATLNYGGGMAQWSGNNAFISGPGALTNASTGTLNVTANTSKLLATAIINNGTINVTNGTIQALSSSSIVNNGIFDLQFDGAAVVVNQISLPFTNGGTLRKSAGSLISTMAVNLTSTGTIDVQTGTLSFSSSGGSVTGTLNAATDATLNLNSLTLTGTLSGTGGGSVNFNNVSIAAGGATINFGGSLAKWNGVNASIGGAGTLTIASTGTLTASGNVSRNLGTSIVNNGTFIIKDGGNIQALTGSSITNTGLFDLQSDGTAIAVNQIALTLTNTGTLRKSAGTGITTLNAVVNSTATLEAQTGTLAFGNGGNVTGTVTAGAGAVLDLSSLTITGNLTGAGAGIVKFASITPDLITNGGTTVSVANLQWAGSNGTIGGGGTRRLINAGTLSAVGAVNHQLATDFVNSGTFIIKDGGNIQALTGSSITNTGLFDLQSDGTAIAVNQIALTLTNTGTLRKSAGTGIATLNAVVNSTATLEAQTGTLAFGNGGNVTGTVTAGAGAVLDLSSLTITGNLTGAGAGIVKFASITPDLITNGGTTISVANLQWAGSNGTIGGGGTRRLINAGTLSAVGAVNHQLATDFVNSGTFIIKDGGNIQALTGSSITNTGLFDLQSDGTAIAVNQIALTLTNTGTLRKSAGTGVTTLDAFFVNNGGTIAIPSGTITLNQGLSFGNASKLDLTGGATANTHLAVNGLVSKTGTQAYAVRLLNDGTLDLTGATQYNWLILDGTNLGTLTPADFTAAGSNFNVINPSFTLVNNDVFLTFNAVPVPEPVLTLVLVGGVVGAWRLRRSLGANCCHSQRFASNPLAVLLDSVPVAAGE